MKLKHDELLSNLAFNCNECHYLKDELIRSYDFNFGFCIPGSTNSWEAIYSVGGYTLDPLFLS